MNSAEEEIKPYWRRVYTRSVFAGIEGAFEFCRNNAFVVESSKLQQQIDLGKLSILAGETYIVTDEGEIRVHTLRTQFLPQMLLSINSFAEQDTGQ